jgi:hypothetical protein
MPQKSSNSQEKTSNIASGATARLSEAGYAQIARLRNDGQMKTFIRRVIKDMGLLALEDGPVNGLVPYYSGSKQTQSYQKLTRELQKISTGPCSWLAPLAGGGEEFKKLKQARADDMGCTVELGESGYARLAGRKSDTDMATFINRVISDMGLRALSENPIHGIAPYYSGANAVQNLGSLKRELQKIKDGPCSWLVPMSLKIQEGIGKTALLNEKGYLSVAQAYSEAEMRDYVERVIKTLNMHVADETGLQGFLPYFDCEKDVKTLKQLRKELKEEASKGSQSWLSTSAERGAADDESGIADVESGTADAESGTADAEDAESANPVSEDQAKQVASERKRDQEILALWQASKTK